MKEEASIRRKIIALAAGAAMLLAVFSPASAVFAKTGQEESAAENSGVKQEEPLEVSVSKVGLDKKTISLKAGKTARLKASVLPAEATDKTVTWTSSDSETAAVSSSGKVTAKSAGTAVITASAGNESASCRIRVSLSKPGKVKARAAGLKTIRISWKKVSGAEGYQIYRSAEKNGTYKKIATVKGGNKTSYKNKKRTTGKVYYYKVRAYAGNYQSEFSKKAEGKARPKQTEVKLKAGEEKIKISWKQIPGAQGYHVYRQTGQKDKETGKYKYERIQIVTGAKNTSYTHSDLTGGKKYRYKVRAYRKVNGEKVFSYSSEPAAAKAKKVKLKTSEKGFQYKKKIIVKAYAYSGGGRTATGTRARVGSIAVDPKVIPLGTKVYVKGYGYAVAEDTGGNIKGNTVDLYMNSTGACLQWGVRYVPLYIDVRK